MQVSGCEFGEPEFVEFGGVTLSMGPRVVILPSFATSSDDLRRKAGPGVKVSSRRSGLSIDSDRLSCVHERQRRCQCMFRWNESLYYNKRSDHFLKGRTKVCCAL